MITESNSYQIPCGRYSVILEGSDYYDETSISNILGNDYHVYFDDMYGNYVITISY